MTSPVPQIVRAARALITLAAIAACPGIAHAQSCSPFAQVTRVRDIMADMYLWYREIPPLNRMRFDSPEQYLEAARYKQLDSSFSYVTTIAENRAYYEDSQYVGFGFSNVVASDALLVTQVFPGSAAADAGLRRGDRIVAVDGRPVGDIISAGTLSDALGEAQAGVSRELAIERDGARVAVRLTKAPVTIPTVSLTRVFDVAGRRVGYLFFRNFVEPSVDALDAAFAEFRRAGVTELVLDLRYNGGGLVSVAQHLGDLIGGSLTRGQVFAVYAHNDRNTDRNEVLRFGDAAEALSLSRVAIITTRTSASASELVANALRPFMPVILIGDRTYGKPVGQYGFEFCSKLLALVSFSLKNADGAGDYFDGLTPTCAAEDDTRRQLGDPEEASLHEALVFLDAGQCSSTIGPRTLSRPERPATVPRGGWRELIGAD